MRTTGGASYNGGKAGSASTGAATGKPTSAPGAAKPSAVARPAPSSNASVSSSTLPPTKASAAPARAAPAAAAHTHAAEQENAAPNKGVNSNADASKEVAALKAAAQESARAYAELRSEMEGLEKERDFYFEKLRDIEIVLQDLEDKGEGTPLSASLFKILYATADGFEPLAGAAAEATKSVDVYPESVPYDDAQESY